MNSGWIKILLVFVAVFAFAKWGPSIPISSVVSQKQDFFTVTGEGKVTVVPDTAIFSVGITTSSPSIQTAQSQSNAVINKIAKQLKDLGIKENDIKTVNYSIYPQYDYQQGNKISGYQINISLSVTVRQLDKINQALDLATQSGANTIGGIQLTVDDTKQKQLFQQARELAVKDAKTKAESLANAAGITLGKIVNIQEDTNNFPRPMIGMMAIADSAPKTNIQPGATDISTTITLFYET
ncbi:MAG: SIMPL domain-containing protein, partial [Patescibacteria group bacterium]